MHGAPENDDDDAVTELEGDGEEAPVDGEEAPVERAASVARPRARPVGPFGSVPLAARQWGIKRQLAAGTFSGWLGAVEPGSALEVQRWPLEDLDAEILRQRWGAGSYVVHWFRSDGRPCGKGPVVTVTVSEETRPAPVLAAPPANVLSGDLQTALALLGVIQQQSNQQISGLAQMAQVMAGGNRGGLDVEVLRLIMGQQQRQSEALVEAVRESNQTIASRLDSLLGGDDDEDDDEDDVDVVGAVAKTAVKPFVKPGQPIGDALKAAAANAFAEDPIGAVQQIVQLLQAAPQALDAAKKMLAQAQAAPPPTARPRAHLRPVSDPAPPDPSPSLPSSEVQ